MNAGEIRDVESISTNVSTLASDGHDQVAAALKALTEAVAESGDLSEEDRVDVLDSLEEISRQATLPEDQRSKPGVVKNVLRGVGGTLAAAGGLAEVWSTWGSKLSQFFGF